MDKLKKWLGLEIRSTYIRDSFERTNADSFVCLSVLMILLELFMTGNLLSEQFFSVRTRTNIWIIQHLTAYIMLISSSIFTLISSIKMLNRRIVSVWSWRFVKIIFVSSCLIYGIFISYIDYIRGEQILVFITMEILIMCVLVIRPIVGIFILTVTFLVFYNLCASRVSASFSTKINFFITWLSILIASGNIFRVNAASAKKAEELEDLSDKYAMQAITDSVSGVSNMSHFIEFAEGVMNDSNTKFGNFAFLFFDIENFKNYNEKYGFEKGNQFLKKTAKILENEFPESIVARYAEDHFVVLANIANLQERLKTVREQVGAIEDEIKMILKAGSYKPDSMNCKVGESCDKARYACLTLRKRFNEYVCEYSSEMDLMLKKKQYIVNNIDKAISSGYIKVFYQPVVFAKDGSLCGLEALARWIDPVHGFLSPADFIGVLEEYRLIHKLDMAIFENVCRDLKDIQEIGGNIPVSANLSRIDFEMIDIVHEVERIRQKYDTPKSMLHLEITESALSEDDGILCDAMDNFRKEGYALWLDDFGSGYSGLNVLKDYDFDMMKIDMKFLRNFNANEKTKPILKSIVSLANQIGMQTLTEGVETSEMSEFLKTIGCERLQGYLFGKPMPKEDILNLIKSGKFALQK